MNNGLYNLSRAVPAQVPAWVVFDGTTGKILRSQGVKSVTRSATGVYTIELNIAMPSIYWAWGGSCIVDSGSHGFVTRVAAAPTTSSITIRTFGVTVAPAAALYDSPEVTFFVIGATGS